LLLQNPLRCAILTWHAGYAPEIGFSAPSKEQLWRIEYNQSPPTLPLICEKTGFLGAVVPKQGYGDVPHFLFPKITRKRAVKNLTLPRENSKTERRVMKQKLKTHKAMAKRVKITGSGKIMRRKVALSHLRRNKSPHSVRSMDKEFQLATSDTRRMKRLLPYSF
jgi:large subunit ribosomal protein L35